MERKRRCTRDLERGPKETEKTGASYYLPAGIATSALEEAFQASLVVQTCAAAVGRTPRTSGLPAPKGEPSQVEVRRRRTRLGAGLQVGRPFVDPSAMGG